MSLRVSTRYFFYNLFIITLNNSGYTYNFDYEKGLNMKLKKWLLMFVVSITVSGFSFAAKASEIEIVNVVLSEQSGTWRADVTLNHADTGWDHYADGWRLVDEQGNVLGNRVLYHPHVNEQPFTRSLGGINIPASKKIIFVEAHDLNRGWSKKRVKIDMLKNTGNNYKIQRR